MTHAAHPQPPVEPSALAAEGELDLERLKEIGGLFLRAPRRHPALAALSLVVPLLVGLLAAAYLPRAWECSSRILAQKNMVMPALGNPNRQHEADSPTKNAADTILQHDNIVALVKQLDLVDRWQATRQPLLRLKDKLTSPLSSPRTDDDRLQDMVGTLNKRLQVGADDSSITISIEWPDRELAFEIVSYLQKNFLEARYDSSVSVITEAIRILEERAKPQAAEVDAALADLTKIEGERRAAGVGSRAAALGGGGGYRARPRAAVGPDARPVPADDAEELEDVRRRIRMLREDHDRQLMQAQNQLSDARATLGPLHPTVVALNEKITELKGEASGLAALAAKEREIVARIARASAAPAVSASPAGASSGAPAQAAAPPPAPAAAPAAPVGAGSPQTAPAGDAPPNVAADLRDDPQVALAVSRLQGVSSKYSELLSRIEAANIELDVTRAAFKYQYSVVRPAELARAPSKPNVPIVLVITLVVALLLGVGVPGALDFWRGRFVEPWQVERSLDIPLLGELTPPR